MDSRPKLFMLSGPVCVGKSTWIRNSESEFWKYDVYSTDRYIEDLAVSLGKTYNDIWSEYYKDAEAFCDDLLKFGISIKINIVWDQTNLTPATRKRKIEKFFDNTDYYKVGVFFVGATKELIMSRNVRPGKIIPEKVVDNMLTTYVVGTPETDPWFDEIRYVMVK